MISARRDPKLLGEIGLRQHCHASLSSASPRITPTRPPISMTFGHSDRHRLVSRYPRAPDLSASCHASLSSASPRITPTRSPISMTFGHFDRHRLVSRYPRAPDLSAYNLISISTPAGSSKLIRASTVLLDGLKMSIRRLWVRISNCSRLSLYL